MPTTRKIPRHRQIPMFDQSGTPGADYQRNVGGHTIVLDWRDKFFFDILKCAPLGDLVIEHRGLEYPFEEVLARRLGLQSPLVTENGKRYDFRRCNVQGYSINLAAPGWLQTLIKRDAEAGIRY